MIGSFTYFVKRNNQIEAHIGGSFFLEMARASCAKRGVILSKDILQHVSKWKKPDATNITTEEVERIIRLPSVNDHFLVGDAYLFVDVDKQEVQYCYLNKEWETI